MKLYYSLLFICIVLLLTGCSFSSLTEDSSHLTIGNSMEINTTDSDLILLDNMDTLATDGLYYASWGIGEKEPYENSEGKTIDLYDAQIYFLLDEYKDEETAQQNMNSWFTDAKANYEVLNEETITCNEQTYSLITYTFKNKNNPFIQGISVFTVSNNSVICIELTSGKNFEEDLKTVLLDFLNKCTYMKDYGVN